MPLRLLHTARTRAASDCSAYRLNTHHTVLSKSPAHPDGRQQSLERVRQPRGRGLHAALRLPVVQLDLPLAVCGRHILLRQLQRRAVRAERRGHALILAPDCGVKGLQLLRGVAGGRHGRARAGRREPVCLRARALGNLAAMLRGRGGASAQPRARHRSSCVLGCRSSLQEPIRGQASEDRALARPAACSESTPSCPLFTLRSSLSRDTLHVVQ